MQSWEAGEPFEEYEKRDVSSSLLIRRELEVCGENRVFIELQLKSGSMDWLLSSYGFRGDGIFFVYK